VVVMACLWWHTALSHCDAFVSRKRYVRRSCSGRHSLRARLPELVQSHTQTFLGLGPSFNRYAGVFLRHVTTGQDGRRVT
jgi:hypothetical protein